MQTHKKNKFYLHTEFFFVIKNNMYEFKFLYKSNTFGFLGNSQFEFRHFFSNYFQKFGVQFAIFERKFEIRKF